MLVNREAHPAQKPAPGVPGGLGIYDVSDPSRPREITFWRSGGAGVHRFTFDGRYAYISPEMDGYVGNIVMILDLADPAKPREVGRWWMPGQWTAGGETPSWPGRHHRCHHPIRLGNRLYVSYWHGGFVILDIEDMSKPTFVSGLDWSPPFITPTHTALPVPFPLHGRRVMLVADEDVAKLEPGPAVLPLAGRHHGRAAAGAVRELPGGGRGRHSRSPSSPAAISRARRSRARRFPWRGSPTGCASSTSPIRTRRARSRTSCPSRRQGTSRVSSNDVDVDDRGLLYLIDRGRGLHILERV